jgi:hypothetical protein
MQSIDNNALVTVGCFVALLPVMGMFVRSYDELMTKYERNIPYVCPEALLTFSGIAMGALVYCVLNSKK